MISSQKQTLRLRVTETLRAMSGEDRALRSASIAGHLRALRGMVFGFAPMRLEPDWTGAIGAGWVVALPRIEGNELHFHRCGFEVTDGGASPIASDFLNLRRGTNGVLEPLMDDPVAAAAADVVLVPGVAFDRAGARLGRGGGFYDRLLGDAALTARRIAVCFASQVVERVPVEPHDAEVDAIVTEDGWIEVRSSGRDRD